MCAELRKPEWLRVPRGQACAGKTQALLSAMGLNTVCREANCPNRGECFERSVATFMILGRQCTRNCGFCNVSHGAPEPVDPTEPERLARAAAALDLRHVVITSVTRDDLPDGGGQHFADCVRAVRAALPRATVEVLIPDLRGDRASLDRVLDAAPDVLNHNLETVEELYATVRPGADYARSLGVLAYGKRRAPGIRVKTGLMLGLGEREPQVLSLMRAARAAGCDMLTIGQYLSPGPRHLPVREYVPPAQFARYRELALAMGFASVASAPLVRSSYRAAETLHQEESLHREKSEKSQESQESQESRGSEASKASTAEAAGEGAAR
jgi:lipoic acid synthetase